MRSEHRLNCVIITFSILLPFTDSICIYMADDALVRENQQQFMFWLVANITVRALDDLVKLVTLICLAIAMVEIRREVTKERQKDIINTRATLVHCVAFTVYLLSLVASGIFFTLRWLGNTSEQTLLYSDIFSAICEFIVEFCLCIIFYSLIAIKFEDTQEESFEPVVVESFSNEEEFQRRVWN